MYILDIVGSITYVVLLNSIYYDTYWKKAIPMSHIKPTAPQNMIEKEFPLDSKGLLLLFLLPRSLVRINLWKRTWYLWSFRARVILLVVVLCTDTKLHTHKRFAPQQNIPTSHSGQKHAKYKQCIWSLL